MWTPRRRRLDGVLHLERRGAADEVLEALVLRARRPRVSAAACSSMPWAAALGGVAAVGPTTAGRGRRGAATFADLSAYRHCVVAKRPPPASQDRRSRWPGRRTGKHGPWSIPVVSSGMRTAVNGWMRWSGWRGAAVLAAGVDHARRLDAGNGQVARSAYGHDRSGNEASHAAMKTCRVDALRAGRVWQMAFANALGGNQLGPGGGGAHGRPTSLLMIPCCGPCIGGPPAACAWK